MKKRAGAIFTKDRMGLPKRVWEGTFISYGKKCDAKLERENRKWVVTFQGGEHIFNERPEEEYIGDGYYSFKWVINDEIFEFRHYDMWKHLASV